MKAARFVSIFALATLGGALAGCVSRPKAPWVSSTRVVAAPAPVEQSEGLDPIPEDRWWGKYVGAPAAAFQQEGNAAFAEARSAYWNGDTPRTVEWLRKAKASGALHDDKFHELLLQCYERDDRWADSLPIYAELGIREKHREWFDYAAKRAKWPQLTVEIAPGTMLQPFTLKRDELVIVDVLVNGQTARVLLDTGAEAALWTKTFAARAGLDLLGERATTVDSHGAKGDASAVIVRELRLTGITARNVFGVVVEASAFARQLDVDGIVGWDVLRRAHLVFDFPARQLEISAPQGDVATDPALGGRLKPILLARSMEGKPLHLFLDSGWSSGNGEVYLQETDGLIRTKVKMEGFRRRWWPPVRSAGLNSSRWQWPRQVEPFAFWLGGYRFETPQAHMGKEEELHDGWSYIDGVISNASFLNGRLTLCGVRRVMAFEPTTRAGGRVSAEVRAEAAARR